MDDGLYVITEKRVLRVFCSLYEAMREDVGQQNTAPGWRLENQESGGWLLSLTVTVGLMKLLMTLLS